MPANLPDIIDQKLINKPAKKGSLELSDEEKAARTEWLAENETIQTQLKENISQLEFSVMVDAARDSLEQLGNFNRGKKAFGATGEQIILREFGWQPDETLASRQAPVPKLRAVYGNAVLLNSEFGSIIGRSGSQYDQDEGEHIESIFYALGVAVEQDENIVFYKLFTTDITQQDDYDFPKLYNLLTDGQFDQVLNRKEDANDEKYLMMQKMKEAFEVRKGWGLDDELYSGVTERVNDLLLATYRQQLRPLVDVNIHLDRLELLDAFNNYLVTNPIIQSHLVE